jgi:penicillin G amidase
MVWLKRGLWLLLGLLILVSAAAGIYVYRSFPSLSGELRATGLIAPVAVTRDAATCMLKSAAGSLNSTAA